jgi:hypothetical protein
MYVMCIMDFFYQQLHCLVQETQSRINMLYLWCYCVIMQCNVLAEGRFFLTTGKKDNLGRLWDREVPLYNLVSCYKSAHKISSVCCVYELCKGFIKLYQKSEVSLIGKEIRLRNTDIATQKKCRDWL